MRVACSREKVIRLDWEDGHSTTGYISNYIRSFPCCRQCDISRRKSNIHSRLCLVWNWSFDPTIQSITNDNMRGHPKSPRPFAYSVRRHSSGVAVLPKLRGTHKGYTMRIVVNTLKECNPRTRLSLHYPRYINKLHFSLPRTFEGCRG